MKCVIVTVMSVCSIFILTGCGTTKQIDVNRGYEALLNQERSFKSYEITGPVSVGEGGKIVGYAPLNPIKALPQNPDTVGKIVDGVLKAGAIAATASVMGDAFDAAKKDPVIVDPPEPIILEPFVLE